MSNQIELTNNALQVGNEVKVMECGLTFELDDTSLIPIGKYESKVIDVFFEQNVKTDNGLKDRLYIEHEFVLEGKCHTIKHSLTVSKKTTSRYYRAGKAIAEKLGKNFDWSVVANKSATIDVQHFLNGQGQMCAFVNEADYDVLGTGIVQKEQEKERIPKVASQKVTEITEIPASNDGTEILEQFEELEDEKEL